MMEQRSQMLRQMRLTKTEREREVSGLLLWGRGGGRSHFRGTMGLGIQNDLASPKSVPIFPRPSDHVGPTGLPFSHGTEATSGSP